jgi:tetratricopeptide (TPR) repeat protein
MSLFTINAKRVSSHLLLLAVSLIFVSSAIGQEMGGGLTPHQERELVYADRLMAKGLAAYSQKIIDGLNLPPEIQDIRKVKSCCALGDFKTAEALVAKKKSDDSEGAWTLRISLADGYYMWGKYDEAEKIYTGFFEKYPNGPKDPSLKGFYVASAYKYAKMMIMTGDNTKAIKAYESALNAKPEKNAKRQIMGEILEILITEADKSKGAEQAAYIKKASKYIEDILWEQDLWFGRAIVAMAHIKKMKGDIDGAMGLIDEYTKQLKDIDNNLKLSAKETGEDLTRLSPMAQCRYMVGVIMQEEANRILESGGDRKRALSLLIGKVVGKKRNGRDKRSSGALQHFLNVFIRYPNTSWAPDAGKRFRAIKEQLESEWGMPVSAKITKEQLKAVEVAQFKEARVLFNQQRYKDAIAAYEQVLALFPESETSVSAISELAVCYIEEKDFLLADVVARHLAERFCERKEYMVQAGDKVVGIAFKYSELGDKARMKETYDVFFKYFKNHPRTAGEIRRFADTAFRENKLDEAMAYYKQIAENNQDDPVYNVALSQIAAIYAKQNKPVDEIRTLKLLIANLKKSDNPGQMMVSAMFRYARAYEGLGPKYLPVAIKKYTALEKLLSDETARLAYQNSPEEAKANIQILQAAMLKHAMADSMRKTVPAKVQAYFDKKYKRKVPPELILNTYYKKGAVKILLDLAKKFPDSVYAPIALSQVGSLYTVMKKPDDARKVLQRLQKEYPESPEAKNVVFTIGTNLLALGMRREAVAYFKEMFKGSGKYSSAQFLTAGKILFDAGEYKVAIEAFDKVIKSEKQRAYLEPARVRKGQALCRLKKYDDAAELLRQVLKDYPSSGYTLDICRSASEAFSAVASKMSDPIPRRETFNEAVDAMVRARKFAKDAGTKAELDIGLARIYEFKAASEKEFGDEEKAQEYRDKAVASYQAVIMFQDPNNSAASPYIQDAYLYCLPLMMEMEKWDDVAQDADAYIKTFPHGKHIRQIRQFKNKARVSGGTAGESSDADTEAAGAAPTNSPSATATTEEK